MYIKCCVTLRKLWLHFYFIIYIFFHKHSSMSCKTSTEHQGVAIECVFFYIYSHHAIFKQGHLGLSIFNGAKHNYPFVAFLHSFWVFTLTLHSYYLLQCTSPNNMMWLPTRIACNFFTWHYSFTVFCFFVCTFIILVVKWTKFAKVIHVHV